MRKIVQEGMKDLLKESMMGLLKQFNDEGSMNKKTSNSKASLSRRKEAAKERAINDINNSSAFLLVTIKDSDIRDEVRVSAMHRGSHTGVIIKGLVKWVEGLMER